MNGSVAFCINQTVRKPMTFPVSKRNLNRSPAPTPKTIKFWKCQRTRCRQIPSSESITTANNALKESQSIQTQLQMNLDSQTSLAKIESVAADTLGMKRVVQSQMNYIGISQGDKGQVITEINQNWLVSAWNSLVNLLS